MPANRSPTTFWRDQDLNQVTWEQRVMAGDPKFSGSQYIPDGPYAKYAELLGFKGIFCDSSDQIGSAWDEALSTTDRPVVLEVKVDQEVPPLPPHIKLAQAKKMTSALMGDEPERLGIVTKAAKGKLAEVKEALEPDED